MATGFLNPTLHRHDIITHSPRLCYLLSFWNWWFCHTFCYWVKISYSTCIYPCCRCLVPGLRWCIQIPIIPPVLVHVSNVMSYSTHESVLRVSHRLERYCLSNTYKVWVVITFRVRHRPVEAVLLHRPPAQCQFFRAQKANRHII